MSSDNNQNGRRDGTAGRGGARTSSTGRRHANAGRPLSVREREIMSMLVDGSSGAQIAERLVLSPETIRTHIRNAMEKLGASSRAQAVALAAQRDEIELPSDPSAADVPATVNGAGETAPSHSANEERIRREATLTALLAELVSLHDVDGGLVYLTEGNGLSLRRAAVRRSQADPGQGPERIELGEGIVGRAALERRAQVASGSGSGEGAPGRTTICVPMIAQRKLVGVICLTTRRSRVVGRSELLLLQAFAGRVAEILVSSRNHQRSSVKLVLDRFRVSWSSVRR